MSGDQNRSSGLTRIRPNNYAFKDAFFRSNPFEFNSGMVKIAPDRCKQSSWLENLVADVREISSANNLRGFTAVFPRRASGNGGRRARGPILDRALEAPA